jgi:hypothetical protein
MLRIDQCLTKCPICPSGPWKLHISNGQAYIDTSGSVMRMSKQILSGGRSRHDTLLFLDSLVHTLETFHRVDGAILWHTYTQKNWSSYAIVPPNMGYLVPIGLNAVYDGLLNLHRCLTHLGGTYASDNITTNTLRALQVRVNLLCVEFQPLLQIYETVHV